MMQITELSIRCALFNAQNSLSAGENLAIKIKENALKEFEQIKESSTNALSQIKISQNMQSAAINAAVKGLEMAYYTINSQLKDAKAKRRNFVQECENHVSTLIISSKKEHNEFSIEENAICAFYKLIQKNCGKFIDYFGIHLHSDLENPDIQIYSVMPFFRMSQSLPQNNCVTSELDQIRQGIYLFLKTNLPLDTYYNNYKQNTKIWMQFLAIVSSDNYLNNLRAPRFIIIAIANLLWNLQHPVNPQYGTPMTLNESVDICTKAAMFLNDILAHDNFPYLTLIDDANKILVQTIAMAELWVMSLHNAFDYERLHEINLNDVSLHMHLALKIMSNKLLELVYQNESAAELLVAEFMNIGTLFLHNPILYIYFHSLQTSESPLYTNQKARTVVDVIILFAHLTPTERYYFLKEIKKEGSEINLQLVYQLNKINQDFMLPFEKTAIEHLELKGYSPKEIYRETAKRFLPLIFLIMESFNVYHDTRPKKKTDIKINHGAESHLWLFDLRRTLDDCKQREFILKDAGASVEGTVIYYRLSISIFLQNKQANYENMNRLLIWQNDMRQKTNFLDELTLAIQENRKVLQFNMFQDQVLSCLAEIHNCYKNLNENINSVEAQILFDNNIHRNEKRVLQPMLDDLETTLELIQKSITQVSNIISSPGFTEQEQQKMMDKAMVLLERFQQSFPELDTMKFNMINPWNNNSKGYPFSNSNSESYSSKRKSENKIEKFKVKTGNGVADKAINGTIALFNPMTYYNAMQKLPTLVEPVTKKEDIKEDINESRAKTPSRPFSSSSATTPLRKVALSSPNHDYYEGSLNTNKVLALRTNRNNKRSPDLYTKNSVNKVPLPTYPFRPINNFNFYDFLLKIGCLNFFMIGAVLSINFIFPLIHLLWLQNVVFAMASIGLSFGFYWLQNVHSGPENTSMYQNLSKTYN